MLFLENHYPSINREQVFNIIKNIIDVLNKLCLLWFLLTATLFYCVIYTDNLIMPIPKILLTVATCITAMAFSGTLFCNVLRCALNREQAEAVLSDELGNEGDDTQLPEIPPSV